LTEGPKNSSYELDLVQHFQVLDGRLRLDGREYPLKDPTVNGEKIKFTVDKPDGGKVQTIILEGRVRRNTVEGTMVVRGQGTNQRNLWKAERNPATMKPIDVDEESRYR
jgi:hypothetical protein